MFDELKQIGKEIKTSIVYDVGINRDISNIVPLVARAFKLLALKGEPNLALELEEDSRKVVPLNEDTRFALKCISIMHNTNRIKEFKC